jgi:tRNA nucleotidyltransferase (CCA-adding enzyme)
VCSQSILWATACMDSNSDSLSQDSNADDSRSSGRVQFDSTIAQAQEILRHSESDLVVVDTGGDRLGTISRRDLDTAAHFGFSHAAVAGHMTVQYQTVKSQTDHRDGTELSFLACLQSCLAPDLWHLLTVAASQAQEQGWQLFLVGGAVRDLLLNSHKVDTWLLEDIDLVVDGGEQMAEAGAGVQLARSLHAQYPQARLEVYEKFQTAALSWQDDPVFNSLGLDIATARTEVYPYPAANPLVTVGSIHQDLYRRDFTINALAIRLTQSKGEGLLDFFGGVLDLQTRQIRVLHANSFIEDPTRIYRAVRFAVRLGFEIEPQTERLIRYAIASGIFQTIRDPANPNFRAATPALQTRLKAELNYILQTPDWLTALHQLAELGALTCIHPNLEANADLWRQLRRGEAALRMANGECSMSNAILPVWRFRLEILLAHLPSQHRAEAAAGLQLPRSTCDRLKKLAAAEVNLANVLSMCSLPSQMVHALKDYDAPMLILMAVRSDRPLRKIIWRYLTEWSWIKPPLNGKALKILGYQPGGQFKQILETLTTATLDGKIRDRAEAEVFLQQHFPTPQAN